MKKESVSHISNMEKESQPHISLTMEKESQSRISPTKEKESQSHISPTMEKESQPRISHTMDKESQPHISHTMEKESQSPILSTKEKESQPHILSTKEKGSQSHISPTEAKESQPHISHSVEKEEESDHIVAGAYCANHKGDETTEDVAENQHANEPLLLDSSPKVVIVRTNNGDGTIANRHKKQCKHIRTGLVLALCYGLFTSSASILVKFLYTFSPFYISSSTNFLVTVLLVPFLIYWRLNPFPPGKRKALVALGMVSTLFLIARVHSLVYLPVADALSLSYIQPVLVLLFARIHLKEPCNLFRIAVSCITILGTFLMLQPSFIFGTEYTEDLDPIGIAAALSVALTFSTNTIILRSLKDLSLVVKVFHSFFLSSIVTTVVSIALGEVKTPTYEEGIYVMGISVFINLAHSCNAGALQKEDANLVSIVRTTEIIYAFILQLIILGVAPSLFTVLGSLLVIGSAIAISMYSWVEKMPEEHSLKQWSQKIHCCKD